MKSVLSVWLWFVGVVYLLNFVILLIILSYLFPKKKYDPILKYLARFFFKLLFIKVKVEGAENLEKDKAYVIMGNHVSMFDIPLLFGFVPVSFVGIEASGHFKMPLYGWALRRYGNIPINRKSTRASMQSILEGVEKIKSGISVVILPEGTRTLTPEMGEFKKFPFLLAQRAEKEIVPFGFSGLWKINNKTHWHINPGKVTIRFAKPIPADTVTTFEIQELMVIVKSEISALITEP